MYVLCICTEQTKHGYGVKLIDDLTFVEPNLTYFKVRKGQLELAKTSWQWTVWLIPNDQKQINYSKPGATLNQAEYIGTVIPQMPVN